MRTRIERSEDVRIKFDCPKCGRKQVAGDAFDCFTEFKHLVFTLYRSRRSHVRCLSCKALLTSDLAIADLLKRDPSQWSKYVTTKVPFGTNVFAVGGMLLAIIPFFGVLASLVGLAASWSYPGWRRTGTAITTVGALIFSIWCGFGGLRGLTPKNKTASPLAPAPPAFSGPRMPQGDDWRHTRIEPPTKNNHLNGENNDFNGESDSLDGSKSSDVDGSSIPAPEEEDGQDFNARATKQFFDRLQEHNPELADRFREAFAYPGGPGNMMGLTDSVPAPATPNEESLPPVATPPAEVDEFAGMSPQEVAVAMANAHGVNNVARIIVRGVSGTEAEARLRDQLGEMLADTSGAKIYVATSGRLLAAVVAPVADLHALGAKAGFSETFEVDAARRVISFTADPSKWNALPIASSPGTPGTAPGDGSPSSAAVDPRLKSILAGLRSRDEDRVESALNLLEKVPLDEAARSAIAAALIGVAEHGGTFQQDDALKLLRKWHSPDSMDELIALTKHADFSLRWEVYETLGEIRNPQSVAACVKALGGEDSHQAEDALEEMGPYAEDAVLKALNTRNQKALRAACSVLAKIGTEKSLPRLKRLARSSDFFVRTTAERAVRSIERR